MSILENFCVGKDGRKRLKSSFREGTVVRAEGHDEETSEYVRRLNKTKMAAKQVWIQLPVMFGIMMDD